MNDLGVVNELQSIQHPVGQFLDAVVGQTPAKELEEMVFAVALTKLRVIQCLPNMLFSGRFGNFPLFWIKLCALQSRIERRCGRKPLTPCRRIHRHYIVTFNLLYVG